MLSSLRWSLGRPPARPVRLASNSTPRPGRNLTERYRKLENTTRGKSEQCPSSSASQLRDARARASISPNTIAGFVIPQEPRAPEADECCMSGCAVCVYDLYEEALVAYKESIMTLRAALAERGIPETEWPAHIRTTHSIPTPAATGESKGAVLDAFEEMERALKEKREKRAAVETEKKVRGDVLVGDGERMGLDLQGIYDGIRWMVFPSR